MSVFISLLEKAEIPDFNESDVKYFEEDGTTNSYIIYNNKNIEYVLRCWYSMMKVKYLLS